MSEWKENKLGEVADLIFDYAFKKQKGY